MKKKIEPEVSAYYRKLGKKSAAARREKLLKLDIPKPKKAETKLTK